MGSRPPGVNCVGIADGAKGNWEFLEAPYRGAGGGLRHAAEYLGKAAAVLYRGDPATRKSWVDTRCHELKHEPGGAAAILKQLKSLAKVRPWAKDPEDVQRAITYFENQSTAGRMDHPAGWPGTSRSAAGSPKRLARSSSSRGCAVRG